MREAKRETEVTHIDGAASKRYRSGGSECVCSVIDLLMERDYFYPSQTQTFARASTPCPQLLHSQVKTHATAKPECVNAFSTYLYFKLDDYPLSFRCIPWFSAFSHLIEINKLFFLFFGTCF